MMDARCPECGAPVADGGSCRDHFHALLLLEGSFPGAPGSILHFYAVASYNLQHPDSAGLVEAALYGLYHRLGDALDGRATLDGLRWQVRRAADGPARVLRRPGEAAPSWHCGSWPMTVVELLEATADTYPTLVTNWARAVRATLDAHSGQRRREETM